MANYLPMAMDPALGEYVTWMINSPQGGGPGFKSKMDEFGRQLDEVMEKYNVTLNQLFHALALEYVRTSSFYLL